MTAIKRPTTCGLIVAGVLKKPPKMARSLGGLLLCFLHASLDFALARYGVLGYHSSRWAGGSASGTSPRAEPPIKTPAQVFRPMLFYRFAQAFAIVGVVLWIGRVLFDRWHAGPR